MNSKDQARRATMIETVAAWDKEISAATCGRIRIVKDTSLRLHWHVKDGDKIIRGGMGPNTIFAFYEGWMLGRAAVYDHLKKERVAAELHWSGDRSVGIPSGTATITVDHWLLDILDNRGEMRQALQAFGAEIGDGAPAVRFEDECPDCGAMGWTEGKCSNTNCISHAPEM